MSPSKLGSAKVEQLIASGSISADDPVTAYVVAYDGARHSGAALLAEQSLRAAAAGGHVALEKAISAQFGGNFTKFGALRRRRHELDYPALLRPR